MNKTSLLGLFVFCSFAFACKRYTCQCTAYNESQPEFKSVSTYKVSKKNKQNGCLDKTTKPDAQRNFTVCEIK